MELQHCTQMISLFCGGPQRRHLGKRVRNFGRPQFFSIGQVHGDVAPRGRDRLSWRKALVQCQPRHLKFVGKLLLNLALRINQKSIGGQFSVDNRMTRPEACHHHRFVFVKR